MTDEALGMFVVTESDMAMLDVAAAAASCPDDLDYSDFYLEDDA